MYRIGSLTACFASCCSLTFFSLSAFAASNFFCFASFIASFLASMVFCFFVSGESEIFDELELLDFDELDFFEPELIERTGSADGAD